MQILLHFFHKEANSRIHHMTKADKNYRSLSAVLGAEDVPEPVTGSGYNKITLSAVLGTEDAKTNKCLYSKTHYL